jgi:tRNA threonylcarbamoyladenosine biosynthesis protein TsaE
MSDRVVLESWTEGETMKLGAVLGSSLRAGDRIGLSGDLGAGKTCFVRGVAQGLGISLNAVRSPSFTLVNIYEGGRLPLYHIDLFRIRPSVADRLALREYLYGDGVAAVEWFENLGEPLEDYLQVSLTFVGTEGRRLVAAAHGLGYHHMLDALRGLERSRQRKLP